VEMIALALAGLSLLLPTPPQQARAGHARMCSSNRDGSFERELRDQVGRGGSLGATFGEAHLLLDEKASAFVLLFNPGRNDEGVYTLQSKASSSGTCLVAFEQGDAAERFSHLLSAEGFDLAQPAEWSAEQICYFCASAQFGLGFVKSEALLLPPRHNVFDEEAFEQLRAYEAEQAAASKREEDPDIQLARQRLERAWQEGEGGS